MKTIHEQTIANVILMMKDCFSPKIMNKTKLLLWLLLKIMAEESKRNKSYPDWKGRTKSISVWRWHDLEYRKTILKENKILKIYSFWFQNLMQININQDSVV